jgi:cathepsin A (carboxypeptidase C)
MGVYALVNTCPFTELRSWTTTHAFKEDITFLSFRLSLGMGWFLHQLSFQLCTTLVVPNTTPSHHDETERAKMAPIAARCELLADACAAFPDDIICGPVGEHCEPALKGLLSGGGHHPWNCTLDCEAPTSDACYPTLKGIIDLFAVPQILKHLCADKQTKGKVAPFNVVSGIIEDKYSKIGGTARNSIIPALTKLINDPSVDVRIYVGLNDWIANTLGVRRYLDNMRFEGYLEFRNEARLFLPWKTKEGKSGGMIKRIDGLWHVELAGGGLVVTSSSSFDWLLTLVGSRMTGLILLSN